MWKQQFPRLRKPIYTYTLFHSKTSCQPINKPQKTYGSSHKEVDEQHELGFWEIRSLRPTWTNGLKFCAEYCCVKCLMRSVIQSVNTHKTDMYVNTFFSHLGVCSDVLIQSRHSYTENALMQFQIEPHWFKYFLFYWQTENKFCNNNWVDKLLHFLQNGGCQFLYQS